jgi:Transposase
LLHHNNVGSSDPSDQYIAFADTETGECDERRLNHSNAEAEKFYRDLQRGGVSVRVGMEATGYSRWFERLLAELGIEVWIGDAAKIKTKRVRKQKTDRQDAQLLLKLLLENNFPRVWVPSPGNRDLRQLLWHRHRLVPDAHADHESAASVGDERRPATEEKAVERARTSTVGKTSVSDVGQPAPERFVGAARPHESHHRGVKHSCRSCGVESDPRSKVDEPLFLHLRLS